MNGHISKLSLSDLGYDDFFASQLKRLGYDNSSVARVIAEHKEAYRIKSAARESLAKITGKQMFNAAGRADYPAVGDWVVFTPLDSRRAIIQAVLPRKTILAKKHSGKNETQLIAANLDVAFVVESGDRDYNLNRLERYFALIKDGDIQPVVILNKIDLLAEADWQLKISRIKSRFPDVPLIPASTVIPTGLDELTAAITRGKTYCFLGSSGVGKSSLINGLLGRKLISTKEISQYSGRGKHTTTSREMYILPNGGIVIDNPGMREVGLADTKAGLENVFAAITTLEKECKFSDCTHTGEPGCAILNALENDQLDAQQFANYTKLKKETAHYQMSELEKRRKDKDFGKFIKKTLAQQKKYER